MNTVFVQSVNLLHTVNEGLSLFESIQLRNWWKIFRLCKLVCLIRLNKANLYPFAATHIFPLIYYFCFYAVRDFIIKIHTIAKLYFLELFTKLLEKFYGNVLNNTDCISARLKLWIELTRCILDTHTISQSPTELSYLMVRRKSTLSLISSGMVLRMCFRARALSFSSCKSGSRLSIQNSENTRRKRKINIFKVLSDSMSTHMQIATEDTKMRQLIMTACVKNTHLWCTWIQWIQDQV